MAGSVVRIFGCWNRSRSESGTCTLLGPEGPDLEPNGSGDEPSDFWAPAERARSRECRPYVENYTVDASILELRPSGLGSTINVSKET